MSKVLIGCEESGVLSSAFRRAGFDSWSCDLNPTRGDPDWHMRCDIMDAIPVNSWDLIILHPDCTALAVSGNRWYGKDMLYYYKRKDAIQWTVQLWMLANRYANRVALENPVSVIFKYLQAPVCYVQPFEHGHGEQKKTGFALRNLPDLIPIHPVEGREQKIWKMAPSPTRKRDRSVTYQGIADAIVSQWGVLL